MSDMFQGVVYAIDQSGDLLWFKYTLNNNTPVWDPNSGQVIYSGFWQDNYRGAFAGTNGVIYAHTMEGDLLWYKDLANDGTSSWDPNSGNTISKGVFADYLRVFIGGDGVIYGLDNEGNLYWHKDWADDGSANWWAANSGTEIYPNFMQVGATQFNLTTASSGGDGVIYAVTTGGDLLWYRDGANNGTVSWDPSSGMVLSNLFSSIIQNGIFAGEQGTVYAITTDGALMYFNFTLNYDATVTINAPSNTIINSSYPWASYLMVTAPVNVTNTGLQVTNLGNETASSGIGYPAFTGVQETCYQDINQQLGQIHLADNFDLRAAYAEPVTYPPDVLLANLSSSTLAPKQEEDPADWTAVLDQLETETTALSTLNNFQTLATANATALAEAYSDRYPTITSTVSGDSAFALDVLSACDYVLSGFSELSPIAATLGVFVSVAQAESTSIISGPLSTLKLSDLVDKLMDSVNQIYSKIEPDWGKVQRFSEIVQAATDLTPSNDDYAAAADGYEVSLYQVVALSTMAVVSASQMKWGSCGQDETALAYIPDPDLGPNGSNSTLCSRLTTLGVNLSNILNRSGGWAKLQNWECTFVQDSWSCAKVSS